MAHAVAEEGKTALDEEHPDERCEEADEGGGDEGPLHEVVAEDAHDGSSSTVGGASGGSSWWG